MKAVAPHDRPREKLQRLGAATLGDNELVAIVIGHGRANTSALETESYLFLGSLSAGSLGRVALPPLTISR